MKLIPFQGTISLSVRGHARLALHFDATMVSGVQFDFPDRLDLREIGSLAVWSLSTAKPGNGVEQLRDDNLDSYWQ